MGGGGGKTVEIGENLNESNFKTFENFPGKIRVRHKIIVHNDVGYHVLILLLLFIFYCVKRITDKYRRISYGFKPGEKKRDPIENNRRFDRSFQF